MQLGEFQSKTLKSGLYLLILPLRNLPLKWDTGEVSESHMSGTSPGFSKPNSPVYHVCMATRSSFHSVAWCGRCRHVRLWRQEPCSLTACSWLQKQRALFCVCYFIKMESITITTVQSWHWDLEQYFYASCFSFRKGGWLLLCVFAKRFNLVLIYEALNTRA